MRGFGSTLLLSAACLFRQTYGTTTREEHTEGTFQNPSARSRPRFRYWIPDASVDLETVRRDIEDAGKVGAGGVELLGYYNYGDVETGAGIIPTDWTKYGWGTPAWRKLQDAALQATKDNGLIIDLSLGPNQGAGVPLPPDAEGAQWDIQPFNTTVPSSGHFQDTLPGWGTGKLISASTGLVKSSANLSSEITYILAADSLQDVTYLVSQDGALNVSFPSNVSGLHHVVFAYYLIRTTCREQQTPELVISGKGVVQSPVTSYVQNGSWVVDHFSAKGAEAVADFWRTHMLNGGDSSGLIKEVGNYIWEDSQEFASNILWTPTAPDEFQRQHGYSLNKYLPILMNDNGGGLCLSGCASPSPFITDEADGGASHVADYRQTMTSLNKNYLDGLATFAKSLGVQTSMQPAYNFHLDMLSIIPHVDAPETETLGSSHIIDAYRQFAGPAGLAGKHIISSEAGAITGSAFQQTIPELLWDLKRSIVGGVNSFVLHGMPFSGTYANTTWPTYTTFFYLFSEMHNRHQPGWDYYRDFMDYTARVQQVMQAGVAKVDLAFYHKSLDYATLGTTQYAPADLEKAGFTYEYLSPDNFSLPAAQVSGGVLAPTQQGFAALIVRGNDTLTAFGVNKIEEWARKGLPIVFSGGLPSNVSGTVSSAERSSINATLTRIFDLENVHNVPYDGLANSLASICIRPRTSISGASASKGTWYTRWRESDAKSTVYIYCDATGLPLDTVASNVSITFAKTGTPYIFDAWTGRQTPVQHYTQSKTTTTIPLFLAGNQTTIICFQKASRPQGYRTKSNHSPTQLSPITLKRWELTIESWTAPADIFDIEGTVTRNSTYNITSLLPWNELDVGQNLTFVSGRGYYHSTFSWPISQANGAFITLSPVLHTAVLYINGQKMPPLDVTAPKADVSRYLKKGVNSVDVVVSTPLGNALIPMKDKLLAMGGAPQGGFVVQEYGLVGEVVVRPYSSG